MSRDPLALDPGPEPSPRVLVIAPGTAGSRLTEALAGAGCKVDTTSAAADLAERLDPPAHDAIVLDLVSVGASLPELAPVLEALGAFRSGPAHARPALIVAAPADGSAGREILPADAWVTGADAEPVVREVRAATALRALHRALAEIQKLRDTVRFARDTAHDLAQPLTTIMARAQLLLGNLKSDHPHYRAVHIICQEAERLARTVEEFSKLKVMAPPPEPREP